RVVANSTPGTTRDSIDTLFKHNKKRYHLVDTAGIRRKGRVSLKVETYSVVDSLRSIERADVVLIVLNAEDGVVEHDAKIAGYAYEAGKSCVFVVNKWDLLKKDNSTVGKFIEQIRMQFKYLPFVPIVFVSALTGQRIGKVMEEVDRVMAQYTKRVSTADLNKILGAAVEAHHPPLASGRRVKFFFATQVSVKPPTFVFFTNSPDGIHFSYERYLMNKLREAFDFSGTPLRLLFKGRER
ncbi:MAG: GTP-binding protein, partial [Deltaproteobacteria bacterium]